MCNNGDRRIESPDRITERRKKVKAKNVLVARCGHDGKRLTTETKHRTTIYTTHRYNHIASCIYCRTQTRVNRRLTVYECFIANYRNEK